jgi:hypothetical protein
LTGIGKVHAGKNAPIPPTTARTTISIVATRFRNTAVFEFCAEIVRLSLSHNLPQVDSELQVSLTQFKRECSMNARVLLLFLVSAMFMAAWNGDQEVMQQAYARQESVRATLLAERLREARPAMVVDVRSEPAQMTRVSTVGGVVPDSVPLPPGITAGRFRAVNQTGTTTEVTVGRSLENGSGASVAHDFYVTDDVSGNRWYLIRIADSSVR